MKNNCVIIDVESALINVAERKLKILQTKFSLQNIDINKVIHNFDEIMGKNTEMEKNFMEEYNSIDAIPIYPASLFEGAKEAIMCFTNQEIKVILMVERIESYKDVIIEELSNKLNINDVEIHFKTEQEGNSDNFKEKVIENISKDYNIVAYIGGKIEEIEKMTNHNISTIVFFNPHKQFFKKSSIEIQICTNWRDIERIIKMNLEGDAELYELRKLMISFYARWLHDIDFKLSICVAIATILCGLSGTILCSNLRNIGGIFTVIFTVILISLVFIFSLLSLIFSIRGYTSIYTSGKNAGQTVKFRKKCWNKIKCGFAILKGHVEQSKQKGDAISIFEEFRQFDEIAKSSAHRKFFHDRYTSYDPDALWNERFFSIRASNYSKIYSEKFASILLIWSIIIMGIWVIIIAVTYFIDLKV
ncbi:MAG: hypothetical protein LBE18_07365 [Planctomycetaceae bacterium]|jgi:soluble P-type ATPase|nr:hypothetical protein [Planctomycetaceae bacterium]